MYSFLRFIVKIVFKLVNGNIRVQNKERLPEGNYVLVGPHRAWFDMLVFAVAASPKKFTFLAKKELFQNPILRWILNQVKVVSVDRDHPGPSVIKEPVKILRQTDLSIIIFPSGSRHSEDLKAGAVLIAKLANVPIVPVVYQGPLTFKRLFSRKPINVAFGDPIQIDRKRKINDDEQKRLEKEMQTAFDQLDDSIDPTFHYVDVSKK